MKSEEDVYKYMTEQVCKDLGLNYFELRKKLNAGFKLAEEYFNAKPGNEEFKLKHDRTGKRGPALAFSFLKREDGRIVAVIKRLDGPNDTRRISFGVMKSEVDGKYETCVIKRTDRDDILAREALKTSEMGNADKDIIRRSNTKAYMFQKYLGPRTLYAYVDERKNNGKPLTTEERYDIAIEAFRALNKLHENGFFHNDINSGNILYSGSGTVHLIDLETASEILKYEGHAKLINNHRSWDIKKLSHIVNDNLSVKLPEVTSIMDAIKSLMALKKIYVEFNKFGINLTESQEKLLLTDENKECILNHDKIPLSIIKEVIKNGIEKGIKKTKDPDKKSLLSGILINLDGETEEDTLKKHLLQACRYLSHHTSSAKGRAGIGFFGAGPENTASYSAAEKDLTAAKELLGIGNEIWSKVLRGSEAEIQELEIETYSTSKAKLKNLPPCR